MKGIAHFAIGTAVASCVPIAVSASAEGNPLYFVLGSIFGLLPDTLDFKLYRFLYPHNILIRPDPIAPDPQLIANAIADAINETHITQTARNVKLDTIRITADLWLEYEIAFDVTNRKVWVTCGPVVDSGCNPIKATELQKKKRASAPLCCNIRLDYFARTKVNILDGPIFRMKPLKDGTVMPSFLPWHRQWSHSVPVALLFAIAGAIIWDYYASLIIFVAYCAHILVDQLGFMGSNLLFPFTKHRTEGMKLLKSSDSLPNFIAVWASCLLIFWNLYYDSGLYYRGFNILTVIFIGLFLPWILHKLFFKHQLHNTQSQS